MTTIKPIKLNGNWFEGYALDIHTVTSTFIGHDEYGHEVFDTRRSDIGELLYQLKYKSDKSTLDEIITTAAHFLNRQWLIDQSIHGIIPVPPSKNRAFQPVIRLAKEISLAIQVPLILNYLVKVKQTPELKNVYGYQERLGCVDILA